MDPIARPLVDAFSGLDLPMRARLVGGLMVRLAHDESGSELVEYAIVLATLSILAMIAYQTVGTVANNDQTTTQNNLTSQALTPP